MEMQRVSEIYNSHFSPAPNVDTQFLIWITHFEYRFLTSVCVQGYRINPNCSFPSCSNKVYDRMAPHIELWPQKQCILGCLWHVESMHGLLRSNKIRVLRVTVESLSTWATFCMMLHIHPRIHEIRRGWEGKLTRSRNMCWAWHVCIFHIYMYTLLHIARLTNVRVLIWPYMCTMCSV